MGGVGASDWLTVLLVWLSGCRSAWSLDHAAASLVWFPIGASLGNVMIHSGRPKCETE